MNDKCLLFLDIDGVLNSHNFHEGAQSNTIRSSCIDALSVILLKTRCKVVLSSAWRYMIHCKAMKLIGFEYMLRTHGLCGIVGNLIGMTITDEECAACGHKHGRKAKTMRAWDEKAETWKCVKCSALHSRASQVTAYLERNGYAGPYVVIDDEDYGFTEAGHPLVLTDGATGLTMKDAKKAIRILKGKVK